MLCIRCHRELPKGAAFCLWCGKRQTGKKKPKAPKPRRAKGTGCVQYIKGLQSPYRAFMSGKSVGYFRTREEAEDALYKLRKKGRDAPYDAYTLAQVYEAITSERSYQAKSVKYRREIDFYWRYMSDLHTLRAKDVRKEDFQNLLYRAQDEEKSLSFQSKFRTLAILICRWCRQHGLHAADYSEGLAISYEVKDQRAAFTVEDLKILYAHRKERVPGIIWFLCMTGCRPVDLAKIRRNERIDMTMHGIWLEGSKTAAGRNRYVPIDDMTWNDVFMPLYDATEEGDFIFRKVRGGAIDMNAFRDKQFYRCLADLGIQPLPQKGVPRKYVVYSCRHTFATLSARAGVDKKALQLAIGHEVGSAVTDDVYIDQTVHAQKATKEFSKLSAGISEMLGL